MGIYFLLGQKSGKKPLLASITPRIASPKDMLTLTGDHFGEVRDSSYVTMAGSRITASKYLSWTNTQIQVELPANVQSGMVTVHTEAGESEPLFFVSKDSIPVAVRPDLSAELPSIKSVTPDDAPIGRLITITGSNFGSTRGNSLVFFTANRSNPQASLPNRQQPQGESFIAARGADYAYEYWSDDEIHLRVPDGATSGQLYVQTDRGKSAPISFHIWYGGVKTWSQERSYVVQLNANVKTENVPQDSLITLYMPRPATSPFQPEVTLDSVLPEPFIQYDAQNLIFQRQLKEGIADSQNFTANFIIKQYAISCTAGTSDFAKNFSTYDKSSPLYQAYTAADPCVPSAENSILALRNIIAGNAKTPYDQAYAFYSYLIDNIRLSDAVRTGDVSPLDLLKNTGMNKPSGDAYDLSIIFTALCRSAGIPAVPLSGILVENQNAVRNHWWTEIYFEHFGWFPVDVALGAGMDFTPFTPVSNPRTFYFGNMDSQHIAFSRGWNQIKPSLMNSKIVQRPRSYALQSIWEEASSSITNYSSLWSEPLIIGIYGAP